MLKGVLLITAFLIGIIVFSWKGQALAVSAEENYKWYCTQCHGMGGKGDGVNSNPKGVGIDLPKMSVTPRNHTSYEDMNELSDSTIKIAIRDGGAGVKKSTLMPPFGKTLTDAEIADLVAYLRKLCKCKGK